MLKGKFSSGIEGALASTLNRDFNWKQNYYQKLFFVSFFDVFKVYLINMDSETAERMIYKKKRLWILGVSAALYYDLKS